VLDSSVAKQGDIASPMPAARSSATAAAWAAAQEGCHTMNVCCTACEREDGQGSDTRTRTQSGGQSINKGGSELGARVARQPLNLPAAAYSP
jgi:hypothetical protein